MSADVLLVLPVALQLSTAVVTLLARQRRHLQQGISVCSMGLLLGSAVRLLDRVDREGILATQMGGWPAPFGITLAADHLTALVLLATGIVGLAITVYAWADVDDDRVRYGFFPGLHVLMAGVCGAFLTGDLFNLFVWFEVLLIASFMLMALGNERPQLEGTLKYALLSLVASAFFLSAVGLLYGMTGTLNLADLAVQLPGVDAPGSILAATSLLLIGFGIKAAAFPFFFWLPASYHTPPVAVAALFAGLLTKVGVYAMLRVLSLFGAVLDAVILDVLLWIAGLTMVVGVAGALVEENLKRLLSFLVVSAIGYMITGLALFTTLGLAGTVFYMIEDMFVITNLFLIAGVLQRATRTVQYPDMGGLYLHRPLLAVLFVIPAFSLAAIPPLSGFWAKLILALAGVRIGAFAIVAVLLVTGLLTIVVVTKIWIRAFLPVRDASSETGVETVTNKSPSPALLVPILGLTALTIAISLLAAPLYELADRAALDLLQRDRYIEAVLNP